MMIDDSTSRVDYFTVTALRQNADKLWSEARSCIKEIDRVLPGRPWRFFGYTGELWTEPEMGHFAYGDSEVSDQMGVICQASGKLANNYFRRFLSPDLRWSRIDLAVDVKLRSADKDVPQTCYDWLTRDGGTNIKSSLITSSDGGKTLYVGSRNSEQFGRLYDKGVHTGEEEEGVWYRYEVEYKRSMAKACVRMLRDRMALDQDIGKVIGNLVWDWYNVRDVPPIFDKKNGPPIEVKAELVSTSDDRKLAWLSRQVSPTVKALIMSGRGKEVIHALGLESFYVINRKGDLHFDITRCKI